MEVNYWSTFKTLWKIQTFNYLRGRINIVLGVIITVVLMVAWLAFKQVKMDNGTVVGYDPFVVASAIGITTMRICMYNMYRNLVLFRRNGIFDRLFSTPISKTFVFFTIVIFNWTVSLGVCAGLLCISLIFPTELTRIVTVNWAMAITGLFFLAAFSALVAFVMAFAVSPRQKNFEYGMLIGGIFYFGAVYILGLGIPYTLVFNKDVTSPWFAHFVYWIDYFIVAKYPLNILQAGWINDTHFSYFSNPPGQTIYWTNDGFGYGFHAYLPYLISGLICLGLGIWLAFIFVRTYEIGMKKYKKVFFTVLHAKNIAAIKKAANTNELMKVIDSIMEKRISMRDLLRKPRRRRRYHREEKQNATRK